MGQSGSVGYLFETKGIIAVKEEHADEDRVMEIVIDAGAEDVSSEDGFVTVTTPRESLHTVMSALEAEQIPAESAELTPVPSTTIAVSGDEAGKLLKLIMQLDELDDTSKVSANFDIDDEELAQLQDQL